MLPHQGCTYQFIEEPPSLSFCDPTSFQPELRLGCAIVSRPTEPFPDILWFFDRGDGGRATLLTPNQNEEPEVRSSIERRTVGRVLVLKQPFEQGRYFCQPRLLFNNSLLQPSQDFQLESLTTYTGLLPCRMNDTLSTLSSRCADINIANIGTATSGIATPTNDVGSIANIGTATSGIATPTNDVGVTIAGDTGPGASVCVAVSASLLLLLACMVMATNILIWCLWKKKSMVGCIKEGSCCGKQQGGPHHNNHDSTHSAPYYAYPETPPTIQSTVTQSVSTNSTVTEASYHSPYSLTISHSPQPQPETVEHPEYTALRGASDYAQHYTSLLRSNRVVTDEQDGDGGYI